MIVLATCPENPVGESEVKQQQSYNNSSTNEALEVVVNSFLSGLKAYGHYA